MFAKNLIAIFVLTLTLASLGAITPAQLQQLTGKETDGIQASQYAQVYRDAFAHLVRQMDQTTGDARYAQQVMLQDICLYAARPGAETQRLAMARALASVLPGETMTPETRYWILLQLERTGKAEVLEVLTQALGSDDTIEQGYARAALEKNPASQATDILLKALATAKNEGVAAGMISSLGNRQAPQAVPPIGRQLDHTNPTVRSAAVTALVKIHTPDAVALLKQKLAPAHPTAGAAAQGLVEIAATSAAPQASAIYRDLYAWSGSVNPAASAYSIRKAALLGLAVNGSPEIDTIILADFKAADPAVKSMAIAAAAVTKSAGPAKAMAGNSDQLDNALQCQLIAMLASRNEPSVIAQVILAMKSDDPVVLMTAIDALSPLKTRESAVLLLALTQHDEIHVNKYAQEKLIESTNDHVDTLLRTQADAGEVQQRAAVIALLGKRKTDATNQLFQYAQSDNEVIFKAALKAIGLSASADKIPALCGMIEKSTDGAFKTSALAAINGILREASDKTAAYAVILKQLKTAKEDQKAALIATLKWSDNAEAMNYCLDLLRDAQGAAFQMPVPQAALEVLTYWSDPMPAQYLLERARTSEHKVAYAQATVDLAKNVLRYDKEQAKKIAGEVKALNLSETINQSADKIINLK